MCCAFRWKCTERKFPVTAFCVSVMHLNPGELCCYCTPYPACVPIKSCMYHTMTLFMHSRILKCLPVCFLHSHKLWIDLHFDRSYKMQPKVLNSLNQNLPLPSTEPLLHHSSAGLFLRPSTMWNIKLLLLDTEKGAASGRSALPPPPALHSSCNHITGLAANLQTLGTGLGKAEWERGEHRENAGK